jgi:hypothetical protein
VDSELLYLFSKVPKGPQTLAHLSCTTGSTLANTFVPWDNFQTQNVISVGSYGVAVEASGYYEISSIVTFSESLTAPYVSPTPPTNVRLSIAVNSTVVSSGLAVTATEAQYTLAAIVTDIIYLNSGDIVTIKAAYASPGNVYIWGIQDPTAITGLFMTYMSVVYLGT